MSVTILGIESSCDDTSSSVIRDGVMLSNGPGDPEPLKGVQEVARQIIEEMPNDLVRRNPSKYTSLYINRLMSMIPNWKRSTQEKVKGLHPAYCDKTGRTKHPWVRVGTPSEKACTTLPSEPDLPF